MGSKKKDKKEKKEEKKNSSSSSSPASTTTTPSPKPVSISPTLEKESESSKKLQETTENKTKKAEKSNKETKPAVDAQIQKANSKSNIKATVDTQIEKVDSKSNLKAVDVKLEKSNSKSNLKEKVEVKLETSQKLKKSNSKANLKSQPTPVNAKAHAKQYILAALLISLFIILSSIIFSVYFSLRVYKQVIQPKIENGSITIPKFQEIVQFKFQKDGTSSQQPTISMETISSLVPKIEINVTALELVKNQLKEQFDPYMKSLESTIQTNLLSVQQLYNDTRASFATFLDFGDSMGMNKEEFKSKQRFNQPLEEWEAEQKQLEEELKILKGLRKDKKLKPIIGVPGS